MEVIDLNTTTRLEPKRNNSICRCSTVWVVEQTRMLECRQCNRVIDPYDFLWRQACQQKNMAFSTRHLREEKDRLESEVTELRRQRTNLKAQVRRLESKAT